jgi:hypothetical protein
LIAVNAAGTVTNTFTFPTNLPSDTANRTFLVATPGFASLPGGVTPNYTMPTNFLFRPDGRVSLVGADTVTYTNLPANGILSIDRNGATAVNSPRNFAGQQGSVSPPNMPPTIALTNPPPGAVLAEPATVTLRASASDPDGSVTNVQFFSGATPVGAVASAPFDLTLSGLTAGNYSFTARATDNLGLSATSAPVSVSVVTPVQILLSAPAFLGGAFHFSFTANPGLRYALERSQNSSDILPFVAFATNVATGSVMTVTDSNVVSRRAYRVRRLPNP